MNEILQNLYNQTYDNLWFTSDEHYGDYRHIVMSRRPYFYHKEEEVMSPEVYTRTKMSRIAEMNTDMIQKFNAVVSPKDVTIHLGDFGIDSILGSLNGDHIILQGNYETGGVYLAGFKRDETCHFMGFNYPKRQVVILSDLQLYLFTAQFPKYFSHAFIQEVPLLCVTHKPSDCDLGKWEDGKYQPLKIKTVTGDGVTMNLFGHIHEKRKIAPFGLNVGVDCNNFQPVSCKDVEFYINAILHHYDDEVYLTEKPVNDTLSD